MASTTTAARQNVSGMPDIKVSARQLFGIDTDMEVPAFSQPTEHVPPVDDAYLFDHDPLTNEPYVPDPQSSGAFPVYPGYPGFDPNQPDINHGEGFFKDLSGHELPNAPHFTGTLTIDYTLPLPRDWLATLHADLYGQSEAWTRIFNTPGYDRLKAYSNVNVAAIFRAMSPDFPTPETMTLPLASPSNRTARANASSSRVAAAEISEASSCNTRRPICTNSESLSRTGCLLRKVTLEDPGPFASRP